MSKKLVAFVPARAGSQRVQGKNTRVFHGHPLMAYTISAALQSGCFERVIVSTDSERTREIAEHYGAEAPFLRPAELATTTAVDIQWIKHAFGEIGGGYDAFSILRPTSPFRQAETIRRAVAQFLAGPATDSLRAVELCRQHPGKMWKIEDGKLVPFLDQGGMSVAWHAMQYQELPKVYVQNSSLEIAWSYVPEKYNSREGKTIQPFLTAEIEGFAIDYESDWVTADAMVRGGMACLPKVERPPYADRASMNEYSSPLAETAKSR